MIITGGENVYPVEVEQVLYRHPNIKEVAVIGVPDEKWGEAIKAFIVLKDSSQNLTIDDVKVFCKGKLACYKVPKILQFLIELPRNAAGKVSKNHLRSKQVELLSVIPVSHPTSGTFNIHRKETMHE